MPVEVRELVIKAIISQDGNSAPSSSVPSANNGTDSNEEMIKLCVDKVLQTIREKNER